jgi:small subunit ribosomal protein S16
MIKIRLTRIGKKGQPQYRIVVAEARSKRDSRFIDTIGFYNPLGAEMTFDLDKTKYAEWLKKGAQPSDTIRRLVLKTSK